MRNKICLLIFVSRLIRLKTKIFTFNHFAYNFILMKRFGIKQSTRVNMGLNTKQPIN